MNDSVENYVNLVLGLQNVQLEMMQLLQTLHENVLEIKKDLSNLTDNEKKVAKSISSLERNISNQSLNLPTVSVPLERKRNVKTSKRKESIVSFADTITEVSADFAVIPDFENDISDDEDGQKFIPWEAESDVESDITKPQVTFTESTLELKKKVPQLPLRSSLRRSSFKSRNKRGSIHMQRLMTIITGLGNELDISEPKLPEPTPAPIPQENKLQPFTERLSSNSKSERRLSIDENLASFKFKTTVEEMFQLSMNISQSLNLDEYSDGDIWQDRAFSAFSLVSCKDCLPDRITGLGGSDLNPLFLKSGSVIDQFPKTGLKPVSAESLFPFCFPEGLSIRIIPRCALDGALRLGWIGKSAERYQLHQFQNIKGDNAHGISITIREDVNISFLESLKSARANYKAAYKILCFWRKYQGGGQERRSIVQTERWNIFGRISSLKSSLSSASSESKNSKTRESKLNSDDIQKFHNVAKLATESFQQMEENSLLGDICIIEQCYILVGTDPTCHSMLFSALRQLIDIERQQNCREGKRFELESSLSNSTIRHQLLANIQHNLMLTEQNELVNYPESEWSHIHAKRRMQHFHLNHPFSKLSFSLPLPQMSSEWGVARLALRIRLPNVLPILQLLLLERSVLIIGESYEEVTACAFALLDLLQPFTWESVFIPQLSEDMMDFLSSPVPYICGAARCKKLLNRIESDPRVEREMMNGLSVIHLDEGKVILTNEVKVQKKLYPHCVNMRNYWFRSKELENYQERLELFEKNKESSINSFRNFFLNGFSPRESLVIKSINLSVEKFLSSLAGILSISADGWVVYSKKDDNSKERYFLAKSFPKPVYHQFEFQKEFSNCQLLASYFEERKNVYEENKEMNVRIGIFIADWAYYSWLRYKRRSNS